jgi:hypothetical protein
VPTVHFDTSSTISAREEAVVSVFMTAPFVGLTEETKWPPRL